MYFKFLKEFFIIIQYAKDSFNNEGRYLLLPNKLSSYKVYSNIIKQYLINSYNKYLIQSDKQTS